jgi:hypothetical protein
VVADSSFAAIDLLAAVGKKVCMITRLRLDATLYDPRRKGAPQPTLQAAADDPATVWQTVHIARWYSQGGWNVEVASGTALCARSGRSTVPLRWVIVRDPAGKFRQQAFSCADDTIAPAQVLPWFVRRWQVEVTFEEARAHLGIETQRQWPDPGIARTTPLLLGLYSMVTLMAKQMLVQGSMPVHTPRWYRKPLPTFSATIALVRRSLWSENSFTTSGKRPDMIEIPRELFERLTDTLSYAARMDKVELRGQDRPQDGFQLGDAKRFLETVTMHDCVLRIAGGVEEHQVGQQSLRLARHFGAAQCTGHDHIGEQQVDGNPAIDDRHGAQSIVRFQDGVAEATQDIDHRGLQVQVVFDDQDGFIAAQDRAAQDDRQRVDRLMRARQVNLERGPMSDLAVDLEVPPLCLTKP